MPLVPTIAGETFSLRAIAVHAYGPSALSSIGIGAVLPVLALRAKDVGASVQVAALVLALFWVGPLLASLLAGALVDRIGERRALVGAGLIAAAGTGRSRARPDRHRFRRGRLRLRHCLDGVPAGPPGLHDRRRPPAATSPAPSPCSAARTGWAC